MQVFAVGVAVAVAPGPDFFMVLRNSLSRGRLAGVMTALGIGSALVVHVVYSVLGLALVIASSPAVFGLIRVCGALYLLSIAVRCLFSRPQGMPGMCDLAQPAKVNASPARLARRVLVQPAQPQGGPLFLSIFSQFMTPDTPGAVRWIYGAEVIVIVTAWFTLLALFLSTGRMRYMYAGLARWIDGAVGVIFGGVGCSILWQEARRVL